MLHRYKPVPLRHVRRAQHGKGRRWPGYRRKTSAYLVGRKEWNSGAESGPPESDEAVCGCVAKTGPVEECSNSEAETVWR